MGRFHAAVCTLRARHRDKATDAARREVTAFIVSK
jgi:hypothetical protein